MKSKFFKQSRNEATKKDDILRVSENEDGEEFSSRQVLALNNKVVITE